MRFRINDVSYETVFPFAPWKYRMKILDPDKMQPSQWVFCS